MHRSCHHVRLAPLLLAVLLAPLAGCMEVLELIPASNCKAALYPPVTITETNDRAALGTIDKLDDVLWFEIARQRGNPDSTGLGTIGGYLSPQESARGGLVILLCGGATLDPGSRAEAAYRFYAGYGAGFRDAGFRVWAPVLSESHPYGTAEVDDLVELLDWLDAGGKSVLAAERVYVVGYSAGATTINFAMTRAKAKAMVSIAGLANGDQLRASRQVDGFLDQLFPCNTAFTQLADTIAYYDELGWDAFDATANIADVRNPVLFMASREDAVQWPQNTEAIEKAYQQALTDGAVLPELSFYYVPTGSHFVYVEDKRLFEVVLEYLLSFESQ